jgi:uncharacterized iron-regulated membrane protein
MTALPAPAALHAAAGKPRRLSYRLHSLFGLKISLFFAFICATGTLATVSHEIEWLLFDKVRATASAAPPDWGAMWDAVRREYPEGWVRSLGTYDRSDADYFAKAAHVALPDGREVSVLVDPGTARVTGVQDGVTFHSFMRGLHYYLFTPGDWGFYLVTALGFVLAGSIATGLLVYKRFWKGLLRRPRMQRDSRTWLGDLHRLGALWSLPFAALIALTSIWYLLERDALSWESDPPRAAALRVQPDGARIDAWVRTAQAAMPGLRITSVSLPWGDGEPVTVQGEWQAWLVRERTNAAFIDPVSGKLLGLRVAHRMPLTERWVHTADPLHFGNFAGLTGKLLWFAFGLMLTGLAVSGAIIHGKRLASPEPLPWTQAWRSGLGQALAPTVLLILAVPTWFYFNGWDSGSGAKMRAAGTLHADGRSFQLWSDESEGRWCARSDDRLAGTVTLIDAAGRAHETEFDAGRHCAELPEGATVTGINAAG